MTGAEQIVVKDPTLAGAALEEPGDRVRRSRLGELLRAVRIVGVASLLRLQRAHRLAWPGILNGYYTTRVMQALLRVGFFDEVIARGSVDPDAFAAAHGLDRDVLHALVTALYSMRVLKRHAGGYALTRDGRMLIEVGRGWFEGVSGYEPVFHELEGLLRGRRHYGVDVTRDITAVAQGSGEIEALLYFPLAIDAIRRGGYRHVLDLGCGEGTFLAQLCERRPEVAGYGVDLAPAAIANGQAKLAAAGLGSRVRLMPQDLRLLREVPESYRQVDFATCFFVLHELYYGGEESVVEFLQTFRRLFPRVPLMVFEVDRPAPESMRKRPGMAVPYYLQHDLSRQRPASCEQWEDCFRRAGFTRIEQRPLGFARSVIFTVS